MFASITFLDAVSQVDVCKNGHDAIVTGDVDVKPHRALMPELVAYDSLTDVHVYVPHGSRPVTVLVIDEGDRKAVATLVPLTEDESDPGVQITVVTDQNKHRYFKQVKYLVVVPSEPNLDGRWESATVCVTNGPYIRKTKGFFSTDIQP